MARNSQLDWLTSADREPGESDAKSRRTRSNASLERSGNAWQPQARDKESESWRLPPKGQGNGSDEWEIRKGLAPTPDPIIILDPSIAKKGSPGIETKVGTGKNGIEKRQEPEQDKEEDVEERASAEEIFD